MALSEEGQLSVLALVVSAVSMSWTFYTEMRRRHERAEDIRRSKSHYLRDVATDYDTIEGSALLAKFQDFKDRFDGKKTKYWEDYIADQPEDLRYARRKLKKFWERTIDAYKAGNLPDDFFNRGSDWLQSGHNYRMAVEPIDIANYYNLGMWKESKHYLDENNRPYPYVLLQDKWEKAYHPEDSIQLAREMQQQVEEDHDWP